MTAKLLERKELAGIAMDAGSGGDTRTAAAGAFASGGLVVAGAVNAVVAMAAEVAAPAATVRVARVGNSSASGGGSTSSGGGGGGGGSGSGGGSTSSLQELAAVHRESTSDQEQRRLAEWLGSGMVGRGVEAAQGAGQQLEQEPTTGATEAGSDGALSVVALERELQQAEALQSLVRRLEFQENPRAGGVVQRWNALGGQGCDGGVLGEGPEAAEARKAKFREVYCGHRLLDPLLVVAEGLLAFWTCFLRCALRSRARTRARGVAWRRREEACRRWCSMAGSGVTVKTAGSSPGPLPSAASRAALTCHQAAKTACTPSSRLPGRCRLAALCVVRGDCRPPRLCRPPPGPGTAPRGRAPSRPCGRPWPPLQPSLPAAPGRAPGRRRGVERSSLAPR